MDDEFKSLPKEEYEYHLSRLQNQIEANGLDGLLLTTPENIYYSTGYRSWYMSSLFRPVYVLVPKSGDPAVIMRILEKSTVKFSSWTNNIYVTGTASRDLGKLDATNHQEAVKKAIKDLIPNAKKIGLEFGPGLQHFASLSVLKEMIDSNPGIDFCDGTQAIQHARMIKSEWEVQKLKNVGYVTDRAIIDTFKTILPGKTTEKDISRGIAQRMAAGGVDKISYLIVNSGDQKYTTINAYATDRVVQYGENVIVDISGHIDGYASDLTRMLHLDYEVPKDMMEMATISSNSVKLGKKLIKPGVKISYVSEEIEKYIENTKYGEYLIHSSGHGIGLNVVEYPSIDNGQTILFEKGMTFAVENGVYPFDKEEGAEHIHLAFRMEDIVLVTETGSQWITGPGKAICSLTDFID